MAVSNKILESLFKPVNNDVVSNPNPRISPNPFPFKKGNLITFNYTFWKNDPYPLIIISPPPKRPDITVGLGKLWGINLHRLTFNDMKDLLRKSKNPNFSYLNSVKNTNLKGSYRSYKWAGIRQVKVLNYEFLLNVISTVRSFDPAEVQIIRKNVQEQIRQQINPKAYELDNKTLNTVNQEPVRTVAAPTIKTVPTVPTVPTIQNNSET